MPAQKRKRATPRPKNLSPLGVAVSNALDQAQKSKTEVAEQEGLSPNTFNSWLLITRGPSHEDPKGREVARIVAQFVGIDPKIILDEAAKIAQFRGEFSLEKFSDDLEIAKNQSYSESTRIAALERIDLLVRERLKPYL